MMLMMVKNRTTTKLLPSLKQHSTRKEQEIALWHMFLDRCDGLQPQELLSFLEASLTIGERRAVALRAAAATLLDAGVSYREIGKALWLTPQTISAVRKALATHNYASNWGKANAQKDARRRNYLRQREKKALPKRYRRTKYGKILMP